MELLSDNLGDEDKLLLYSLKKYKFLTKWLTSSVCYMFRRVLRLFSGKSIQNTYKGRYIKYLTVLSVKLNLATLNYL